MMSVKALLCFSPNGSDFDSDPEPDLDEALNQKQRTEKHRRDAEIFYGVAT
jgi:hypothetical protein